MAGGLILCGMKHCGKSTLGRMLANRLLVPFWDLDDIIEEMHEQETGAHVRCRDIYNRYGRPEFRTREAAAAGRVAEFMGCTSGEPGCCDSGKRKKTYSSCPPTAGIRGVLAVGGGTPANRDAMTALEGAGYWIYLEESPEILYNRILAGGLPPFLEGDDPKARFDEIYSRRSKLYRSIAQRIVSIDGRGIDESFDLLHRVVAGEVGRSM
jgi:shikimate kinase